MYKRQVQDMISLAASLDKVLRSKTNVIHLDLDETENEDLIDKVSSL